MGSVVINDLGYHHPHNLLHATTHAHARHEVRPKVAFTASAPSFSSSKNHSALGAKYSRTQKSDQVNIIDTSVQATQNPNWQPCGLSRCEQSGIENSSEVHGQDSSKRLTMSQCTVEHELQHQIQAATADKGQQDMESSYSSSSQHTSPVISVRSPTDSHVGSPHKIRVNSLSHIQSFAMDQSSPISQAHSASGYSRRAPDDAGLQYEISSMPVTDIIEMVAGLLTKITTTNDRQYDHLHRQVPSSDNSSGLSQQTTSVLAFHGKNVPSITILSYLTRIHKYCPTTYEVFLSLLIYFDRMTERVNTEPMNSMRQDLNNRRADSHSTLRSFRTLSSQNVQRSTNTKPDHLRRTQSSVDTMSEMDVQKTSNLPKEVPPSFSTPSSSSSILVDYPAEMNSCDLSHFFVVDSFNIHRLVIAGVTCASKFFSDVFYTNSRYAKVSTDYSAAEMRLIFQQVGGLPLPELNHLELQFLLLNDFRLSIPVEELEAYGTMLVEFYAREVVAQRGSAHGSLGGSHQPGPGSQSIMT